jgi:molecular chaperone GrpE
VDEAWAGPEKAETAAVMAGQVVPGAPEHDVPVNSMDVSAGVLAELRELRELFDSKIRYDETKERQVDVLHQELQGYRQGLYQQIMRPVMGDLISIYDEMADQLARLEGQERDGLGFLIEMVEITLERYEVTRFTCEGDAIDRSRQKVIDTGPTGDPELGRRLARRVRPGFEMKGKVIRPEWVVAYRYVPEPAGEHVPEPAGEPVPEPGDE